MRKFFAACIILLASCAHQTRETRVAEKTLDATVKISSDGSVGSGFFASPRLIVTAAHVVDLDSDDSMVIATRKGGRCKLVRQLESHHTDLALLIVDACEAPSIIPMADREAKVGQRLYAAGHPVRLPWVVTEGIVSSVKAQAWNKPMLQISAPVNPGMSGGPVVDEKGRLIGITVGMFSSSGMWAGIGFAVPAHDLEEEIQELAF